MILHSSAPMRLSIAGGGTDLPEYYRLGATTVTAAALAHRVHVVAAATAQQATDVLDGLARAGAAGGNGEAEAAGGAENGAAAWEYLQQPADAAVHAYPLAAAELLGLADRPALAVGSTVPPGSGLGGSGAYCVALLGALAAWSGRPLSPPDAAGLAFRLEREALGRTIGQQDAWAAALGGVPRIRIAPDGAAAAADSPGLAAALTRLIASGLCLYRIPGSRDASAVLARAPQVTEAQHRTATAAAEQTEQAFRTGEITVVGQNLRGHWARKVAGNPAVDHPVCRRLTADGPGSGVLGFKLIGAGGGGHLLIAADPAGAGQAAAFLDGLGLRRIPLALTGQGLTVRELTDRKPADRDPLVEEDACASA